MIGVFGGSGFYEFLDDPKRVTVDTPYGPPAADVTIGTVDGVDVAFLPRHGSHHELPPHRVPFRANVWAMKEQGVERIIGPCAAGSLHPPFEPGHFVVCDQLVDWTTGRERTFFDGPEVRHLSFADPYCPTMRRLALGALQGVGATAHDGGTVVVIQGPRFSTRAESSFLASQGWGVINMTQAPEVDLTRELAMCYVNISVITDYDVGVIGSTEPVTHEQVLSQFAASIGTLRDAVRALIGEAGTLGDCSDCTN